MIKEKYSPPKRLNICTLLIISLNYSLIYRSCLNNPTISESASSPNSKALQK
jgi:hypothetical protein